METEFCSLFYSPNAPTAGLSQAEVRSPELNRAQSGCPTLMARIPLLQPSPTSSQSVYQQKTEVRQGPGLEPEMAASQTTYCYTECCSMAVTVQKLKLKWAS